jgi:hypothetical protein
VQHLSFNMVHQKLLSLAFGLSAINVVLAQDVYIPPKLRVSQDNTCGEGPLLATEVNCSWYGNALCATYDGEDLPGFPTTDTGDITGWISGADVYTQGCKLLIYETEVST